MQLMTGFAKSFGLLAVAVALSAAPSATGFQPTNTKGCNSVSAFSMARSVTRPPKASSPLQVRSQSPTSLCASIETNDEVKDPSTLISAQDDQTQQSSFILISSGIFAGSVVFLNLYNFLEVVLPPAIFDPFYTVLPYVLSLAFISAGIAHFAIEDTFTSFVPPKGSWGGLWQVPSPGSEQLGLTYEQYHSFWSGIAEVLVGSWLILATATANGLLTGGVSDMVGNAAIPAALMWMLTAAVTPANIYMYTHNPVVPRIPALPYPWGHGARGLLQCALLGVFSKLTIHSL